MMDDLMQIEIPERNIILDFPLSLARLTEAQYVNFFSTLYRYETRELDFHDFSILVTYDLLGLKKGKRKIDSEQFTQAMANISLLAENILNYFEEPDESLRLKLDYQKNHIKEIKTNRQRLYGPKDYFRDSTFGQYEDGLNCYLQYIETPSLSILAELTAHFFIDKKKKLTFEQRKNLLMNVDQGYLYGFFYTFAAFHKYFSGSEVYYNGQLINLSILFKSDTSVNTASSISKYPSLGMKSTTYEIAKTGILGNITEVRNTELWEVSLLLYDIRTKDLEAQKKLKKPQ